MSLLAGILWRYRMNLLASQHDSSPELSQDAYKIIPLSCRKHSFAKNHSSLSILGGLFLVQHKPTHTSVPFQRAWRFSIVLCCTLGLCSSAIRRPLRSSQVLLNKTFSGWSSANTKAKGKERRTFLLFFFLIYLLFSFVRVCGLKFEVPLRSLPLSLLGPCSPAAPQNGLAFWLFFTCGLSAHGRSSA